MYYELCCDAYCQSHMLIEKLKFLKFYDFVCLQLKFSLSGVCHSLILQQKSPKQTNKQKDKHTQNKKAVSSSDIYPVFLNEVIYMTI